MKKIFAVFLSGILFFVNFLSVSANNETNELDEYQQNNITLRQNFIDSGVDIKKVDNLVYKVNNGIMLDAFNPIYSDLQPAVKLFDLNEGHYIEKYVYPDGSIKKIEVKGGLFDLFRGVIQGGNHTSTGYYYTWTNAQIFATWGPVTATYRADFEGSNTGEGQIHRVYDPGVTVAGGTFANVSLTIQRQVSDYNNPAKAQLYFEGTLVGDWGQSTFYLRLYVPHSSGAYCEFSTWY